MAKIETIIPFVIFWETGVKGTGLDNGSLFLKARAKGVAFDPDDAGGLTVVGVTIRTFCDYRRIKRKPAPMPADLAAMAYDEWLDILKCMFWDRWQADRIADSRVAHMLVDWVWTSGVNGIRIPQRLLGVKADGIVGERTLAAVNSRDPVSLFAALKRARMDFIESICRNRPANMKFRAGWLRRIEALIPPGV